jgi:hypothetical protein
MTVSSHAAGSATIGTSEWSLTTNTAGPDSDTTAGGFQVFLDLGNLANGDTFEFRVYETINSNQVVINKEVFNDAQGTDGRGWEGEAHSLRVGWDMTLKKTAGSDRSIAWHINKIA